jgi:uncharacterized protein (DUF1697 family)
VSRFAAFLGGINVGGHRVKNDELRLRFEEMGFHEVATFRASGNVVFAVHDEPPGEELTDRIERELAASLGYRVPTFLRTAEELSTVAAAEPFDAARLQASKGKLQVGLLAARPTPRARKDVLKLASDEDLLAFGERELYWLPSGGILDSALDFKAIGVLLGPMTLRTKNTVTQIAAKHLAA